MDPRKNGEIIGSCMHFILFEGLVKLNPDSTTSPAQAERIELSEDRLTYTFHLRDTKWSNGLPVTAYDFEKSWKDVLDPSFPSFNAHLFYPIRNAEAVKSGKLPLSELAISAPDEKTFVVHLERPTPYFLELVAFCPFFPVSRIVDEKDPNWAVELTENFVSNGPFLLKEWKHNYEIVVEKNPDYWDKEHVGVDKIELMMVANEMTALQMYEKGDLDIVGSPAGRVPTEAIPDLIKKGLLNISPCAGTAFCTFNTREYPFNSAHLRRAFAYAIDRQAIVDHITLLGEDPATALIGPAMRQNQNESLFEDANIEKAREELLLALEELEISVEDLQKLSFIYTASDINNNVAQALQEQWLNALGIWVELQHYDTKSLMDLMVKGNYTFGLNLWVAQYPDPMNIFERFKYAGNAKNYPHWENKEYISLLEYSSYDLTPEKRSETLRKAEQLFLEEMPLTPIYHMKYSSVVKSRIHDVEFTPIGNLYYTKLKVDK